MSDAISSSAGPAYLNLNGSSLTTALQQFLMCDEIVPGSDLSYQICKTIYLYHPLGGKMVEGPLNIAQSQGREITVPKGPEERAVAAFAAEWDRLGVDGLIFNVMRTARIYGIGSIVLGVEGIAPDRPIDYFDLPNRSLYFNSFDPLNTAGSMVLNQDPNSPEFQKVAAVAVQGQTYHRSRACVMMNGSPIYISYTASAFGYVGRSVYLRALFPLKSFVQSMITDDMVTRKAGVLIAKMKGPGSIINNLMQGVAGIKRAMLRDARTDNVLGIGIDESIETLNMQNIDGAAGMARKNILENIAASDDMPAIMLNSETFAGGLAEGTEDAKRVAKYVERMRISMRPLYTFFDKIVMHTAWTEEFYRAIQSEFPEYRRVTYKEAFFEWANSFKAVWPSLLIEPESEQSKTQDVKLKALIGVVEVLMPSMDPDNKALLLRWMADNINAQKVMFSTPLELDWDAIVAFTVEQIAKQEQLAAQGAAGPGGNEAGDETPKAPAPENLAA